MQIGLIYPHRFDYERQDSPPRTQRIMDTPIKGGALLGTVKGIPRMGEMLAVGQAEIAVRIPLQAEERGDFGGVPFFITSFSSALLQSVAGIPGGFAAGEASR
jgi:hypothetical protein